MAIFEHFELIFWLFLAKFLENFASQNQILSESSIHPTKKYIQNTKYCRPKAGQNRNLKWPFSEEFIFFGKSSLENIAFESDKFWNLEINTIVFRQSEIKISLKSLKFWSATQNLYRFISDLYFGNFLWWFWKIFACGANI